ncbi:histidinol-phosphatase HisJ [Halobacillus andaensis]|uniref:histidinol-phosphatase HisJ n=1 Tax=Halobacillus andaensis TaxID=1176239 RepID=UPI003D7618A6
MNDGHIHTPYCPHGSSEPLKSYVERAISHGYTSITFTEHAPLPEKFIDPVPDQDSAMKPEDVEDYIQEITQLKKTFSNEIDIRLGFEVDYINGYERDTEDFLNRYGPYMDDSILSVHFLKPQKQWYCIDFSTDMFRLAMEDAGSIHNLYQLYFDTLEKSALADLGNHKPLRIGHMTLIKKFQLLYDPPAEWHNRAASFLDIVKKQGMALDYNGAGTQKEHCLESYPPQSIARLASSKGIPLIYGSDAHHPAGLNQGLDKIEQSLITR